jgi:hypothetical protein
MNETKTMGLRLPVQAAVNRTATGAALTGGTGIEASQVELGCDAICNQCGWTNPWACAKCALCELGVIV